MTPEQILFRLRQECKKRGRKAALARATGLSRSHIGRLVSGERSLSDEAAAALLAAWSRQSGAVHAVVQLNQTAVPPPPAGALAEAMRLRAGDWSRETLAALRAVYAEAERQGMRCTVGQWPDAGDVLEQGGATLRNKVVD